MRVHCPACNHQFGLGEVVIGELEARVRAEEQRVREALEGRVAELEGKLARALGVGDAGNAGSSVSEGASEGDGANA